MCCFFKNSKGGTLYFLIKIQMFLYDCQINQIMKINYFGRIFKGGDPLLFDKNSQIFIHLCKKSNHKNTLFFDNFQRVSFDFWQKIFIFSYNVNMKIAIFCQKTKGPPFENQIKTSHFYDFYMKKKQEFFTKKQMVPP